MSMVQYNGDVLEIKMLINKLCELLSAMMNCKKQSKLFVKFMKLCGKRMGRLVKQDLGISIKMLLAILAIYELELANKLVTQPFSPFMN